MNKLFKYGGILMGIALLLIMIFPSTFLPAGVTGAFALAIFVQTCQKNVSGASKIFIADKAAATAFVITSGEISGVTGAASFMRVDVVQDSLSWKETIERVGLNNIKVGNVIKFKIMPPNTATNVFRQALQDGSPCGYFTILMDGNGKCWLVGHNATDVRERPLRLKTDTKDTGEGLSNADGNTSIIELDNECAGMALPFDAANTATIIGGTAAFCKYV